MVRYFINRERAVKKGRRGQLAYRILDGLGRVVVNGGGRPMPGGQIDELIAQSDKEQTLPYLRRRKGERVEYFAIHNEARFPKSIFKFSKAVKVVRAFQPRDILKNEKLERVAGVQACQKVSIHQREGVTRISLGNAAISLTEALARRTADHPFRLELGAPELVKLG